jgi:hypothetical protein
MPEYRHAHRFARSRRSGLSTWGNWLVSPEIIIAVGTVVLIVLTVLLLDNAFVTGGIALVGGGWIAVWAALQALDPDRRRKQTLRRLTHRIEDGPPGVVHELLPPVKPYERLVDDLERRLEENDRLCVIRLRGRDILETPPGIAQDAIPESIECQRIVGALSWSLEKAPGLGADVRMDAAVDLRGVVSISLRESDPLSRLRRDVVSTLGDYELAGRLVPLIDARKEALHRPAGQWLLTLLDELGCTFGVLTREPGEHDPQPGRIGQLANMREGRRYVSGILSPWLSEQECNDIFTSLCATVGGRQGLDLDLLKIRCAVIAAAAGFGAEAVATQRLLSPVSAGPSTREDRAREVALEVRWLVDRRAALIARGRGGAGAFDRLAVIGKVTLAMFGELMKDLGLGTEGARELYDWLRGDEFGLAGVVDCMDDAISLGDIVRDAALTWLRDGEQSAAYQDAQVAAERCYRVCLVLDRTHVPAPGYQDWTKLGYAGLHLFEIADWWRNVYAWSGHVAEIESLSHRRDAGVAITCLFLETWWWWGDQLRGKFVDDVLHVARTILAGTVLAGTALRDQVEWIGVLEEFDRNYVPEFDLRAGAGDRWRHVADALGLIADNFGLRQGEVPADPVLARIYICWCFFSGDVAQQAGRLEVADAWFRDAARACGDAKDNAAMRAFADYQRADVWIASDPGRAMRLITQSRLAEAAVTLEDLSLRAYVARMHGDIRWESGDIDGAFDAYGRALLLSYVYQVDQESDKVPPNVYCRALFNEMRTRFLGRLDEARGSRRASAADRAIERITHLFGPYWELKGSSGSAAASGEDPLAGVVPPLPEQVVLETFDSGYARDALLMLNDKLADRVAEPVDQLLPE